MTRSSINTKAMLFANERHGKQPIDSKYYCLLHQNRVLITLEKAGYLNDSYRVASWLHDTIHERVATYDDLKESFGKKVADMVYAVTYELGHTRRESMELTWKKIALNRDAFRLKLADYVANWDRAYMRETGRDWIYLTEMPEFSRLMASSFHHFTRSELYMWGKIKDCAIQTLFTPSTRKPRGLSAQVYDQWVTQLTYCISNGGRFHPSSRSVKHG